MRSTIALICGILVAAHGNGVDPDAMSGGQDALPVESFETCNGMAEGECTAEYVHLLQRQKLLQVEPEDEAPNENAEAPSENAEAPSENAKDKKAGKRQEETPTTPPSLIFPSPPSPEGDKDEDKDEDEVGASMKNQQLVMNTFEDEKQKDEEEVEMTKARRSFVYPTYGGARNVGPLMGDGHGQYNKRVTCGFYRWITSYISGHNEITMTGSRLDCMKECCRRSWCKSFDYHNGQNKCDLSHASYTHNSNDFVRRRNYHNRESYDHYEAHSKWCAATHYSVYTPPASCGNCPDCSSCR